MTGLIMVMIIIWLGGLSVAVNMVRDAMNEIEKELKGDDVE